jgi:photosystem II stability/assembly factor-like uncharacterized protein
MLRPALVLSVLLAATVPLQAESDLWEPIGPEGGNVTALAVDPHGAGVVYAGTDHGGLWKSADGGASWAPASSGLTDGSITAIAVDPLRPGVVYVGTGASGVFRSSDAAATWAPFNQGLSIAGPVAALALDPVASRILWVSILSDGGFGPGFTYESTNGARSWSARNPGAGIVVTAILIQAGAIYLGTTGGFSGNEHILKSTDAGATWTPLAVSGVTSPITGLTSEPSSPATLYAGSSADGVFRSRNAGATWSAAGTLVNPDVTAVAADPARPGTVYAATQVYEAGGGRLRSGGVFRSGDGGSTWQRAGKGMPLPSTSTFGTNTLCLAVDPAHPGVLYAGNTTAGVYRSTDHAAQWSPAVAGLRALALATVAADPRRPGTIYAGSSTAGLYRTTDGGATWQALLAGTAILSLTLDPVRSRTVYAGADGGIFISRDGGNTWTETHPGLAPDDFTGPVAIDPTQRSILYAGTLTGVFKSVDSGATWTPPADTNALPCLQPLTLAVDPRSPSDVYVGGTDSDEGCASADPDVLLDKSQDGGVSWQQIGGGLGDFDSLVIAPQTSTLYAAINGGVYTSGNGGASWQATGLAARSHAVDVVLLDSPSPGALYAGDFGGGIFWSPDGGASWSRLADPLTQRIVLGLALAPSSATTLYAATAGGLFQVQRQP